MTSLLVGGRTWLADWRWRSASWSGRWITWPASDLPTISDLLVRLITWLTSWPGCENTWPASWFGRKDTRLANWRWRQYSRSLCDALPATLQSTKPHYRQQGRVCKAGTGVTVDVSSEERTSDLAGRWKHVTCFMIGRKDTRLADWIWRQRSRSFELAGRLML